MKRNSILRIILSISCFVISSLVLAYDEPGVDLGFTSFLDGGPPAGPGVYFQDYLQYYSSSKLTDNHGNRLPLPNTSLALTTNVTQLIYLSTKKVFGANLGVSALLPWVLQAKVNDGLGNTVLQAVNGAGDVFIGPVLQYDPIMRHNSKDPLFVQRLEFDVAAPLGRYNKYIAITPGSNFWSFNPYWATTLWITRKWTGSMRLHYLWNAKNHAPNVSFGPYVYTTQAGQAVFADLATDYGVTDQLRVGINGYFFNQFTDTRANGIRVPGRREKVWAIGPGMLYTMTKNQFLFFNAYSEQDARNRPQGSNFVLRYVLHV